MTSRTALDPLREPSGPSRGTQRPSAIFLWCRSDFRDVELDRGGTPGGSCALELVDVGATTQRQTDVVEPLEQPPAGVVVEVESGLDIGCTDPAVHHIDRDDSGRISLHQVLQ